VWIGAGALGRSGRVALYVRDDVALLGAPARGDAGDAPDGPLHAALRERLAAGAAFWSDLLVDVGSEISAAELQDALWDLVWAGEVSNDAFAPLRAPRLSVARDVVAREKAGGSAPGTHPRRSTGRRGRFSARGRSTSAHVQGRWSLTTPLLKQAGDPAARRRARAELLLERYGVLTREQVLAEGVPGGFSGIYSELTQLEVLGIARRGYFVEGLGGAQFAVPGAVERLRERHGGAEQALVLGAVDPAQAYGAALPWPKREGAKSPSRVAGAQVVLVGGKPVLYLERGGKGLQTLVPADDVRLEPALAALSEHVRSGRGAVRKLALEKVDGEPALRSPLSAALLSHGFQEGPRRLTLSA
jgi:ATP-dependent Lhr-like helicase